ncbi:glyoxylase-like metal-dependent hydrolase (beta-lactamase superfamily II) [Clostridium acetobutylicum]|uniref:Metallo-beta-lactamase superfamily hydrolase n=1 Tax=Clostridium acetobutylicum (strain ATCC 824 / DSM 792 / JCM 1419 / IAM 19013 / LMG 5710 / NBRC 13948 / NRRL B-527 / VKM B-1787 / 2291 / W) TaxID=272562 RepID=Q97D03_CLOAB|nr:MULTISPECIES: MBL fold metallo-hydrolase [Clostridium]AAK81607.1 Metallo-beta-lactamase superfamily hydrolase [Clostridium acetobutylicum ATCC 824]ADZ22730.1 Metallo-beta-lactamase superfamily hydrolase [Clostridium acetobutylicum EA 2018]AEI32989.1 metallo-beta-lactamase superfamily hydrolase [Clostridium acetobutylicum DSM 1731]AWV80718.1 MBL fold metallo-hydrolase [Clostridium acetobutylicum]MBC2393958.1 MBL fold metallo-hydrolase [Clostridium acetobutylicum]
MITTKLKLSVTNDYLLRINENRYVLIDTGYKEDWKLFLKRLKENGIKINEISYVILTHHHDDHVGFLNKLVSENKDIRVVMSDKTNELIKVGENDQTHGGGLINKRIEFLIRYKNMYVSKVLGVKKENNLKFPPYESRNNDIIFTGEVTLRELGIDLPGKIIETPGHTIDSISILFEDGDCFVGDAAANMLKLCGTKNCVIFIMDKKQYYESWDKMIKVGVKKVYPAHGGEFSVGRLKKNIWRNL